MFEDDELPPEAFDWRFPPKGGNTARTHKKRRLDPLLADIDLYNELRAQYGPEIWDGLIEGGFTARAFIGVLTHIEEDLDLWFQATGQLLSTNLGAAERLALECWLWETHDRSGRLGQKKDIWGGKKDARDPDRWKPKKSTDHDRPWPAPPFSPLARWIAHGTRLDLGGHSEHAPRRWSPRRWLGPGQSAPPLQISITRTIGIRAQLEAEFSSEVAHSEGRDEFPAVDELSKRNHPNPGGFYGPKRGWWGPETEPGCSLLGGPQPVEYCREIDEQPPKSVLLQTHEPPRKRLLRAKTVRLLRGIRGNDYWKKVKARPILHGHVVQRPAHRRAETRRWVVPQRRYYRAQYTIDLIWRDVEIGPRSFGAHLALQPFFPWVCHVTDCPFFDEYPRRVLDGERLRSPYEPRGFEQLFRQAKSAIGWAATVPEKRPGPWAQRHVEAPANALSEQRKECRRRSDAAIDGLLSNFGF